MEHQSVVTRCIRVVQDRFAPGHLGELTRVIPFEMVDDALASTRTTQQRLRELPIPCGRVSAHRCWSARSTALPCSSRTAKQDDHARREDALAFARQAFDLYERLEQARAQRAAPRPGTADQPIRKTLCSHKKPGTHSVISPTPSTRPPTGASVIGKTS